ncbi:hypothetical protein AB1S57_14230, partial [Klebsiella pneumoniae]|uniref:hypothetical protein n=1 Tax=Klebsiella pneumoniae TaxID=573 RepID=UPI00345DBAC6
GNCQASNKAESPVERPGFLFLRLKRTPSRKVRGFLLCGVYLPPVALRLPGLRILGHLLAEGTSMPQSYRRQS